MDGKNFSKLCKDCGIVDKNFSLTDADLTFSKVGASCPVFSLWLGMPVLCVHAYCPCLILQVKTKGARKITYAEFKKAVEAIASKKVQATNFQSS